jgi:hypothetical protein
MFESERDAWAAAADELADEVVGEVDIEHDPVGGHMSQPFSEIAEHCA